MLKKLLLFACCLFALLVGLDIKKSYSPDKDNALSQMCIYYAETENLPELEHCLVQIRGEYNQKVARAAQKYLRQIKGLPQTVQEGDYNKSLYRYLLIDYDLKNKNASPAVCASRADFLKNKGYAALIYARLSAIYAANSDIKNRNIFAQKAVDACQNMVSMRQTAQVMRILADTNNFEAFENLLRKSSWSNERLLELYWQTKNKPLMDYLRKSWVKKRATWDKETRVMFWCLFWFYDFFPKSDSPEEIKRSEEKAIKAVWVFQVSQKGKNWYNASFPLYAFVAKANGNAALYEHYKRLSLSEKQFLDTKRDRINYVMYAATAFAMAGDGTASVELIKSLDNRHRMRVLRNCIYNIMHSGGEEAVKELL